MRLQNRYMYIYIYVYRDNISGIRAVASVIYIYINGALNLGDIFDRFFLWYVVFKIIHSGVKFEWKFLVIRVEYFHKYYRSHNMRRLFFGPDLFSPEER